MENTAEVQEREDSIKGVGCSRKRKEDARFVQGTGRYTDDLKLPGMLFADMVRSPYAHARIKSINKEKALALPGVHAVLTADDLKPRISVVKVTLPPARPEGKVLTGEVSEVVPQLVRLLREEAKII